MIGNASIASAVAVVMALHVTITPCSCSAKVDRHDDNGDEGNSKNVVLLSLDQEVVALNGADNNNNNNSYGVTHTDDGQERKGSRSTQQQQQQPDYNTETRQLSSSNSCSPLGWHPGTESDSEDGCTNDNHYPNFWSTRSEIQSLLFHESSEECCRYFFAEAECKVYDHCGYYAEKPQLVSPDSCSPLGWHPEVESGNEDGCSNDNHHPIFWSTYPEIQSKLFHASSEECCRYFFSDDAECKVYDRCAQYYDAEKTTQQSEEEIIGAVVFPATVMPTDAPTTSAPTGSSPTSAPSEQFVTYIPGDLTTPCDNGKLMLSTGMACKLLTHAGSKVIFADGTQSIHSMHGKADGAGVISNKNDDGGWYYASNSESGYGSGGVGVLRFASNGDLIGYNWTLSGTSRNCGGGVTAWGTWISCEEYGTRGYCHEVDPHTGYTKQVNVVSQGGNYESFAYNDRDPDMEEYGIWGARFFTTEDRSSGALTRYTPPPEAFATNNTYDILSMANGVYEYLVLDNNTMTFDWSTNRTAGEESAKLLFRNSEGIDVYERTLNFVSKGFKKLITLDLENKTWVQSSTVSGAFNLQPDQLGRMIGDGEVLYFAEDGGSDCDIHGRDSSGQYFTIVRGDGYSTETTGLAFSPDSMFMYVAFQSSSNIYSFWRTDGLPFSGKVADTKYH